MIWLLGRHILSFFFFFTYVCQLREVRLYMAIGASNQYDIGNILLKF